MFPYPREHDIDSQVILLCAALGCPNQKRECDEIYSPIEYVQMLKHLACGSRKAQQKTIYHLYVGVLSSR